MHSAWDAGRLGGPHDIDYQPHARLRGSLASFFVILTGLDRRLVGTLFYLLALFSITIPSQQVPKFPARLLDLPCKHSISRLKYQGFELEVEPTHLRDSSSILVSVLVFETCWLEQAHVFFMGS